MSKGKTHLFSVAIINYNTSQLLFPLIHSISEQGIKPQSISIIDNASTDNFPLIFKQLSSKYKKLKLTSQILNKNSGFAKSANLSLNSSNSDFIFILNTDLILAPNYFETLLSTALKQKSAITASPTLLLPQSKNDPELIDSLGIHPFPNRRFVDYGQSKPLSSFNLPETYKVFAVSGSAALYRKSLIQKAQYAPSKYFDESFFMYKEDIDLCWRLNNLGESIIIDTKTKAWHHRGTGVLKTYNHWNVFKSRSKLNKQKQFYAYINQRLTILGNDKFSEFLKHSPSILFKELLITLYLLTTPSILIAIPNLISKIPQILKKRIKISKKTTFNPSLSQVFFTKTPNFLLPTQKKLPTESEILQNLSSKSTYLRLKSIFEPPIALIAILILSPIFIFLSILLILNSGFPIFFTQTRLGKNNKTFKIYKFRTMQKNVPNQGLSPQTPNDPRLTSFGSKIRNYGLDELPQLFNILLGQMSFVGPRPEQIKFIHTFTPLHNLRHKVKPGITGYWQLSPDHVKMIHETPIHDLNYLQELGFKTDLNIITKTIKKLLNGFGI